MAERLYIFNRNEYNPTLLELRYTGSGKNKKLWMRIFGHTRLSDINRFSYHIEAMRKTLPDYMGKSKSRSEEVFKRNIEVIETYQEIKNKFRDFGFSIDGYTKNGSIADEVVKQLKQKYPDLNKNLVYKILNKTKK